MLFKIILVIAVLSVAGLVLTLAFQALRAGWQVIAELKSIERMVRSYLPRE